MSSFLSARRMPFLALGVFILFASVLTVMRLPENLTSDVTSGTCGNGILENGEDCERGVASFANPCLGNEQCNMNTCLCASHARSTPSPVVCLGEGEKGAVIPNASQCCPGLTKSGIASESDDHCANLLGVFRCTKSVCGDGVCGKDENKCSCPQDCTKSFQAPVCGNGKCEWGEELPCPPCEAGSSTCTCSSCSQDCGRNSFRYAAWQCYDGTESKEGGETSCKDSKTWQSYANDACGNKCSSESLKCGVNSFKVWEECGSFSSAFSVTCIKRGGQGSFQEGNSGKCCEGLRLIKHAKPDPSNNNQCVAAGDMSFFCASCGNGSCDASDGENSCSCPQDCITQTQKCAEEGQTVYGNPQFGPVLCCSKNAGIKPSVKSADNNMCVKPNDGSLGTCVESWWRTCGDGVCGNGEDSCNCRKDCGQGASSSAVSTVCGNGILEPGERCDRGIGCPVVSCAEGSVCPGYMCNDSTCRCEWESPSSSSAQPTTTTRPVPVPITNSSFASAVPAAGFEDEVLTAPVVPVNPFSDTDLSTPEGRAAADLYDRGIIGGYADGQFKAERPVNRAEAAKFLLLAKYGTVPEVTGTAQFPDVLSNQWYARYVLVAAEKGIISGYPDGTFRPANTVNTAEFLKMMALTFDLPQNLPFTYADVPSDSWFAPYAGIAAFFHLFPSRTTQLLPQSELMRKDVVIAIARYLSP